jgi:hypothetical protein
MQKFLFLSVCTLLFKSTYAQINDTTAIKALLEKESVTWRAADVKGHSSCWYIQPYSRILVSTADGHCYDVPPMQMMNHSADMMGKGGFAINSNFTFSIQGKSAWVSHDEVSTAADGTKSFSHEIRMLEKIKGQWKLVGQSIHLYKPE